MRDKGSYSPCRSHTQTKHEGYAHETPGNRIVAPALEHGYRSNQEEQDCDRAQKLKPHESSPLIMVKSEQKIRKDCNHSDA